MVKPSITHQHIFSYGCIDQQCKIVSFPLKPLLENPSKPTKPHEFCMENRFHIFGSCNGWLLCFMLIKVMFNYGTLLSDLNPKNPKPFHSYDKRMWVKYHGFGYDHINDKYKLLVVVYLDIASYDSEKVTQIYTFGGTSWTTIENFPSSPGFVTSFARKFVSGTLNWLIVKRGVSSNQDVILFLSFDLVKETYKELCCCLNMMVTKFTMLNLVFGVYSIFC
ncbi:uncharacterized protein LOC123896213 [Trifolium pratense]|uniref:uncharacterized protein LOC123896213 n=1 Tax=Trifolium pratense TaxID=57577 RepID=UPI001E690E9F|nr:uncharacterized protein LOC123896213 [Trifolium pratense]